MGGVGVWGSATGPVKLNLGPLIVFKMYKNRDRGGRSELSLSHPEYVLLVIKVL